MLETLPRRQHVLLDDAIQPNYVMNLDFAKERIAVRGGNVDLGDVPEGPVSLLLIVTIDGEERAVQVRAVRKTKVLKY